MLHYSEPTMVGLLGFNGDILFWLLLMCFSAGIYASEFGKILIIDAGFSSVLLVWCFVPCVLCPLWSIGECGGYMFLVVHSSCILIAEATGSS